MPPKKAGERDSMPRRPTDSMMEPAKTVTKAAEVSMTSQVKESVTKTVTKMENNPKLIALPGFASNDSFNLKDPDHFGWLSLKHLNTLLLRYIGVVHDLEEDSIGEESGEINISIDEKEMTFLDVRYKDEIAVWSDEQKNALAKIAELEARIAKLKAEIEKLIKSGNEFDATIKEKETLIEKLRMEVTSLQASLSQFFNQQPYFYALVARLQGQIVFLTGELNSAMTTIRTEEIRGDDIEDRLNSLQAELKFKIEVLDAELASETQKTKVDISSMDIRIKGEYINRLKVEIDILRGTYEEFMKMTQEKLEEQYKDKLAKLELDLTLALSKHSSSEDIAKIRIQIEELRARIKELTDSNMTLSMSWSQLSVKLHEEEATFSAQMSIKERQLEHYSKETVRFRAHFEELNKRLLSERAEVQVYDRLLTPEIQRIKGRHSPTPPVIPPTSS